MPSPCCLLTVARCPVAPERRPCGAQLPVQFAAPVEFGQALESGRRLGLELAFSHGLDLGRSRGIEI
ncbi:hypothetical protein [Bradyrhizobium sp.]|jgi:hypothetical protein|uniref:hypothetical protein n=1 Tax=Bradyrhizobium sp. TaxID=376 RepID=UPI003C29E3BE